MTDVLPLHVSHLADDGDPASTACGEPWQSWQHGTGWFVVHVNPPREHVGKIRPCRACLRVALRG